MHELAWMLAMAALGRSSPFESVVSVEELKHILKGNWRLPPRTSRRINAGTLPFVVAWLQSLVREDRLLRAPWPGPGPDREAPNGRGGFWEWDVYSPERMQERLRAVLTGARARGAAAARRARSQGREQRGAGRSECGVLAKINSSGFEPGVA